MYKEHVFYSFNYTQIPISMLNVKRQCDTGVKNTTLEPPAGCVAGSKPAIPGSFKILIYKAERYKMFIQQILTPTQ
jgi:hypothetical protein